MGIFWNRKKNDYWQPQRWKVVIQAIRMEFVPIYPLTKTHGNGHYLWKHKLLRRLKVQILNWSIPWPIPWPIQQNQPEIGRFRISRLGKSARDSLSGGKVPENNKIWLSVKEEQSGRTVDWQFMIQLNLYETDLLFRYLSHHLTWHCLLIYGFSQFLFVVIIKLICTDMKIKTKTI